LDTTTSVMNAERISRLTFLAAGRAFPSVRNPGDGAIKSRLIGTAGEPA